MPLSSDEPEVEFYFFFFFIRLTELAANDLNPLSQRGDGDTSPLLVDGRRRDILTAFQRYRNSRLSADFQTEITDRSLAECLDECLRQVSHMCPLWKRETIFHPLELNKGQLSVSVDDVLREVPRLSPQSLRSERWTIDL